MRNANAMGLIDTHSHLFWDSFKGDFEEVVQRAVDAGVKTVVNVGVDTDLSRQALGLESGNPEMKFYSSIGIHPEEAVRYSFQSSVLGSRQLLEDIKTLEEIYLANKGKVIGVGECGLDFAYFSREGYLPEGLALEEAKDLQRQLFKAQIDLAKKLELPILVHCRDDRDQDPENSECWDEVLEMVSGHFGILHCYSGLPATTTKALGSDFLFSFAGNITYKKNEYLREAVKIIPLERIVLETDCPFLPPQSIRGQRNEPSSVKEIAEFIAEIKGISFEDVAGQTTENALRLFKLQS